MASRAVAKKSRFQIKAKATVLNETTHACAICEKIFKRNVYELISSSAKQFGTALCAAKNMCSHSSENEKKYIMIKRSETTSSVSTVSLHSWQLYLLFAYMSHLAVLSRANVGIHCFEGSDVPLLCPV